MSQRGLVWVRCTHIGMGVYGGFILFRCAFRIFYNYGGLYGNSCVLFMKQPNPDDANNQSGKIIESIYKYKPEYHRVVSSKVLPSKILYTMFVERPNFWVLFIISFCSVSWL